jgi:hypothetical protein
MLTSAPKFWSRKTDYRNYKWLRCSRARRLWLSNSKTNFAV